MRASTLLVGFLVLSSGPAQAQTVYLSSQHAAPYVPLVGGTTLVPSSADDGSVQVPIGFTFRYYGVDYDTIVVGVNGGLVFVPACGATACPAGLSCNNVNSRCQLISSIFPTDGAVPSATTPNTVLAAWWDDLILNQSTPSQPASIETLLLGTAPNRELVIQWTNLGHYPSGASGHSTANFQIHLLESASIMRIAYGPFSHGSDDNSWTGSVGFEDQTGTLGADLAGCAMTLSNRCELATLLALTNQVIEIGVPNAPELTGDVFPPTGANPGDRIAIGLKVDNIGLQPTPAGTFFADLYLTANATITPATDLHLGRLTFAQPIAGRSSRTATLSNVLIPASLPPGYYNIGAFIDSTNVIPEFLEDNNIVLAPFRFLLGAELSAEVDAQPLTPGAIDRFSFRVVNGGAALGSVEWKVFLSVDTALDAADLLLAHGHTAIGARPRTTITATASVPAVTTAQYHLIVSVDPNNLIHEADETNNIAVSPPFLVGPELTAAISGATQSGPGEQVSFTAILRDSGSGVASVEWRAYLSSDQLFDAADLEIARGTTPIGTAANATISASATVPASITPGAYYLLVVVDPDNLVQELDETNNVGAAGAHTQIVGPDLVATDLRGDAMAFRGMPYHVHGQIQNGGGAQASAFFYTFNLSTNQLITIADPLLGEYGPINLPAGQNLDVDQVVTVPATLPKGPYYLGFIVDSNSTVLEERETNNIARLPATVEVRDAAPDFSTSDLHIAADGAAGELLPIERSIDNLGNAPGTVSYQVYLTPAAVFDPGTAIHVGSGTVSVDPGQSSRSVDQVRVPIDTPAGIYYAAYLIDPAQRIDQLDRSNDLAISVDTVSLRAGSLVILTHALPMATVGLPYAFDLAAQGGRATYSWSIQQGSLPDGVSLDPATGRISGLPTHAAMASFTVVVSDGLLTAPAHLMLLVAEPTLSLRILTHGVPPCFVGHLFEYPLTALGGVPPYSWTLNGTLISGLRLSADGVLSGTPSAPGSVIVTFKVTDATGSFDQHALALRAIAPDQTVHFGNDTLDDGVLADPYQVQLSAVGGSPPYTFSLAQGDLPPGLAIDGDKLSGVPDMVGQFEFQLRVSDSRGDGDSNAFVVSIKADRGLSFITKTLPLAQEGVGYAAQDGSPVRLKAIAVDGNSGTITYSEVAGALPPGLTLDADGSLHGTPAAAGLFAFTAQAIDVHRQQDFRAFGLEVDAAPSMPMTGKNNPGGCGCRATSSDAGSTRGALLPLAVLTALILRARAKRSRNGAASRPVRRAA